MIHAIYDLTGCDLVDISGEQIMTAMRQSAVRLGCTVRTQLIDPFQPHGATCVLVLAESHLLVSTWPECGLAHIDVFTCRAVIDPREAVIPLLNLLGGQVTQTQHVPRLAPPEQNAAAPYPTQALISDAGP
ncbi:adenosylmethionine decarboxylase [Streptosporangium sp. CA-115845]|uniref:adenosylmethionine decarboxylase n=1 Tax=Streptosporangium sp. CA-115845 TaxID=3240071 RepID=UPI003D92E1F2